MAERTSPHILVAEDESFQRLALTDILNLCDYEVTSVENGQEAYDLLKNENYDFDLLLLDLNMPEMNGFELLSLMSQNERMKKVPVIVMSGNDSQEVIASCLQKGAKDFVVKPLRIQECRALVNHMKPAENVAPGEEKGLKKYERIRSLGRGAAGTVELIRKKADGELFALKTIPLYSLNERERKLAESEVQFLRVLVGPTMIRFFEAFIEKDYIYIVMEYAEGGNLSDRIAQQKSKGTRFTNDQILNWIAQITLGVMFMHSKNILHRDIKSQNMFLTKGDILKIGDFGISKELSTLSDLAKTSCGTPYFMPPEVCKGELYGPKADVWAIGCILYELACLRKPFDSETIKGVFDKIINEPIDPPPSACDSDVQMLIMTLLEKDDKKRPDVWEIAKIPYINSRISKFIEENNCQSEVMMVFQHKANKEEAKNTSNNPKSEGEKSQTLDGEKLDELGHFMRKAIPVQDVKRGWIKKFEKVAIGRDIFRWVKEHKETDDKKARAICQSLIENKIIMPVENDLYFDASENGLYRFYADRQDVADNLVRAWKGDTPKNALELSIELVAKVGDLYNEAVVEQDEETEIDAEKALQSGIYSQFLSAIAELEHVDLGNLSKYQTYAFFLNVYQVMYIHCLLKSLNEDGAPKKGLLSSLKSYVWRAPAKPFKYCINAMDFSLEELKHGVLRSNKRSPGAFFKTLSAGDRRCQLLNHNYDPRVNFVALDMPELPEQIECFENGEVIDKKLRDFVSEYLSGKVTIDAMNGEISLPKILETYREDFGGSDEKIVNFVWNFYENDEYDIEQVLREVKKKTLMLRYE